MCRALWVSVVVACVSVPTGYAQQGFLAGIGDTMLSAFMETSGGPVLPGDLNGDASVDLADFSTFRGCMNGPNRPPAGIGCAAADIDGDGDVDAADYMQFQALYAQAGKPSGTVTASAEPVGTATDGVVTWNARAIVYDGDGNPIDMSQPINPALYPTGVWLQWTISCVVTGNNQGLAGAMVGWGIQDANGNWAPFVQDPANLYLAPVYKAPGVTVNGTVADNATAGGLGAGPGAAKGWPADSIFYVDQMGMGYLDWQGRRYKTTVPKGWVGNQQWGMGLESRKAAILRDGVNGTYDLAEGVVEITSVPPGTYHSAFDPLDKNITSKVLNVGQDLNQDLPAVDMTAVPIVRGDAFSFTIVGEVAPGEPTNAHADPPTIFAGQCTTLFASPGAYGDTVEWFADTCPGVPLPGGMSPSVCPMITRTYYARTRNTQTGATSACVPVTVTVTTVMPTLSLVPEKTYVNGQEEIQVAINVSHLTEPIVGGQFFLEYTGHGTCWVFAGGTSVPPFDVEINQNQPAPGKIDYAVSVLPGTPASQADGTMAILHMMPMPDASGCCRVSIGFREHDPATLLTTSGGGQVTPLQLVPAIGSKVDITIDMEAPTITCPPNQNVPAAAGRCDATVNPGRATATDNCTAVGDIAIEGVRGDGQALNAPYPVGTTTITWTATDQCGNASTCVQTITVRDMQPPVIACPTAPPPIAADASCGAVVPDLCSLATIADNCGATTCSQSPAAGARIPLGTTPVTLTATDLAGNVSAPCTVLVTVEDRTPPTVTCPANMSIPVNASCQASIPDLCSLATIQDNCDPAPTCTQDPPAGTLVDPGTYAVGLSARDAWGNVSAAPCVVTVTAVPYTDMQVSVELSPTMAAGPIERCIRFELCKPDGSAPVVVDQVLTFTNGRVLDATVRIPCGIYSGIAARDPLHTLRQVDETFGIVGGRYVANFVGNPKTGGNWLIGGNLNDDRFVDILDYGVLYGEWNRCYGPGCPGSPSGNTTCSTMRPHGDISGNGTCFVEDLTFIIVNFLKGEETCPAQMQMGLMAEGGGPVERISVADLVALGMAGAVGADMNKDGWLDATDMQLFLQASGAGRRAAGDLDEDGDVDLADFGELQACFNGPNRPAASAGCEGADLDGDADVDLSDFARMQACFNGPNRPPACP